MTRYLFTVDELTIMHEAVSADVRRYRRLSEDLITWTDEERDLFRRKCRDNEALSDKLMGMLESASQKEQSA